MDHITVIPSKRFVEILQELQNAFGAPDSIKQKLNEKEDCSERKINLTTHEIKWCHTKMRERGISERVHELLSESEIVLPKYEPPPRNPELEARIQRLRFEQENREYRHMTRSVDASYGQQAANFGDIGKEMKSINKQMVSGAQYLLSIVGTFFAVFIAGGLVTSDYGVRALVATVSAVAVGLAEMFFIIREDLREEDKFEKKK
ncbi:transmembrane protein 199-like [Homarus americanus]|uniref:Transmembrane protein 199-like n=1 Tax=Homarus americanus TaxID=6706 RepID=A0A8J5MVB4_HOMAM|nr:transmembrane protein 199-like [Homarus americanus]KAG7165263.1 Transmembrane protein 199-like [Homarus americanus]